MSARKLLTYLITALILLSCLIAAGAATYFPVILKSQIKEAFAGLGFSEIEIGKVAIGKNEIVFSDIKFDEDGFSTLQTISATFDWQTISTQGKLNNIHIEGMTLTSILESSGAFSLAGWSMPAFEPFAMPAKSITFKDIILDIDTIHGALRFQSEGSGIVDKKGNVDIQALVWGEQNQIQIKTMWNGSVAPDGSWALDCEIQEGRLNLTDITASRLGGWVSMGLESIESPVKIGGQLVAGMLTFGVLPLQNVSAVINGTPEDYQIIVNGSGGGTHSLNFQIEFGKSLDGFFGQGNVDILNAADLATFITAKEQLDSVSPASIYLSALPPLTLELTYLTDQSRGMMHHPVAIEIHNKQRTFTASSLLELDLQKKALLGTIQIPETSLIELGKTFSLKPITGLTLVNGSIAVSGNYFMDFQIPQPVLEGPVKIYISDLSAENADLAITGVNSEIILAKLHPLSTEGKQYVHIQNFTSGITLSKGIISFDIKDQTSVALSNMEADFGGGKVSLDPVYINDGKLPSAFSISLNDLVLSEIIKLARLDKNLRVTGTLDGLLKVNRTADTIFIEEGIIKTDSPGGHIAYTPEDYPPFLQGEDQRLQVVRSAITQFDYNELSLQFSGPLAGEMQARFEAKGYNRDIFGNRPIHLNLNMEGPIPILLKGTTNY